MTDAHNSKVCSVLKEKRKKTTNVKQRLSHIRRQATTSARFGSVKNIHKFKHNVGDTVNPVCPSNDGIEDTEHLLLCPSFDAHRRDLLAGVFHVLRPFLSSLPP